MTRWILTLLLSLWWVGLVGADGVTTPGALAPRTSLYNYKDHIEIQEDFVLGTNTNGSIGGVGFAGSGTLSQVSGEAGGRLGLFRLDTTSTSATLARINYNVATAVDPASTSRILWVVRLNTNDTDTLLRVGSQNTAGGNPAANGIYLEKLAADTDWFCVTRSGAAQTRTDSTIAVSTSFVDIAYIQNSSGVQFYLNGVAVCGLMTTNITTTFLAPTVFIINSAAASKTVDVDYFEYTAWRGVTR
jgi:hypothetical protein